MSNMVTYKHYCRICNKGFGCGPALGGHMRAHGIVNTTTTDEHYPSPSNSKRMGSSYGLRSNSSNRVCDNCGKDFLSLESFINHGKHSSDSDDEEEEEEDETLARLSPKRLRRNNNTNNLLSSQDEDLANCLMLLSSSSSSSDSCESASKAKPPANNSSVVPILIKAHNNNNNNNNLMFECKACKKVFSSHQALGGHRASHKKVKGCFASKLDGLEEEEEPPPPPPPINENVNNHDEVEAAEIEKMKVITMKKKKKAKVHECSICQRQFGSGQALGGHKRCHWITSNLNPNPNAGPTMARVVGAGNNEDELTLRLDLNIVPALAVASNHVSDHDEDANINDDEIMESVNERDYEVDDGMVKLARLSELKDVIHGGGGDVAPWLQVGIGS